MEQINLCQNAQDGSPAKKTATFVVVCHVFFPLFSSFSPKPPFTGGKRTIPGEIEVTKKSELTHRSCVHVSQVQRASAWGDHAGRPHRRGGARQLPRRLEDGVGW